MYVAPADVRVALCERFSGSSPHGAKDRPHDRLLPLPWGHPQSYFK